MSSPTAETSLVAHRTVLDTNVIIGAGSRWLASDPPAPANPFQRLVYWVAQRHVGVYCDEILEEYVELLERRSHPPERIARYVAFVQALFTCITVTSTSCHTPPTDPDDIIFVLCALDGDADVLVSDDKHLQGVRAAYLPRPDILRVTDAGVRLAVPTNGHVTAEGDSA